MASNPNPPLSPHSKPPRGRSSDLFKSNLKIEIVELIDIDFNKYPIPNAQPPTTQCKYCQLKERIVKPGEVAKCLVHSLAPGAKEEPTSSPSFSPQTPPSKPKKSPYDNNRSTLDSNTSVSVIEKVISLCNQLSEILEPYHKTINFFEQSELSESIIRLLKYIPQPNSKSQREASILQENETTLQFQLSSFEESYHKREGDDSLKGVMEYLLREGRQGADIQAGTVASFVSAVKSKMDGYEEMMRQYESTIDLLRKSNDKFSTDHTIKQFSDEFNWIDKISEFGEMSLKDGRSVCLMCRYRGERTNDDMVNMIAAQAQTLETLIQG